MQECRACSGVVWLPQGLILVVGGRNEKVEELCSSECLERPFNREVQKEAATPCWRFLAPMRHARVCFSLCHFRGRVLAVGGMKNFADVGIVEAFDPPCTADDDQAVGQWTQLNSMTRGMWVRGLLPLQDSVVAAGPFSFL